MTSDSGGGGGAPLKYTPALDGIRGVSVLAVIGYHAFGFPRGGFLGVQAFFVLSGFLITALLLQERERCGRISLRAFYRRRALRLLPAVSVVVAAYLVIRVVRAIIGDPNADGGLLRAGYSALFGIGYVSNAVIAWCGDLPPGLEQLWSLAAEEQFYLVWPLTLVLLIRVRKSNALLLGVASAGLGAVVLHRLQLALAGAPQRRLYYAPDATADAILAGCILGILYCSGNLERVVHTRLWRRAAVPSAVLTVVAAGFLVPGNHFRPLFEWLLPLIVLGAAAVIAVAACDPGSPVTRILSHRCFVSPGRISYGLYLWHSVLIFGLGVWAPLPAVLASFAAAYLSFVYVERPFLRRRWRPEAPSDPHPRVESPALATP